MSLTIVKYGHPALRTKGKRIETVDDRIRTLALDMLNTMYDANGVGLAAQQVGVALQLCTIDATPAPDSQLFIQGQEVDLHAHMPMVLLNVEITPLGEETLMETEGCLSLPKIQAKVSRYNRIQVKAMNLELEPLEFEATERLSRVIQHECDHLNGVLFIDHLSKDARLALQGSLKRMMDANRLQRS